MSQPSTASQSLHFRVRDGLCIHRKRLVTREQYGKTTRELQVDQFGAAFGKKDIDLLPTELAAYAHAVEPTDEASTAALEALHFCPPVREVEITYENAIVNKTVAATVAALVAAGIIRAPKAAAL